ncbi:hypothetical protein GIB67_006727 [Kingdonia uniflora]|uniref:RING-type domain-containing protein n=1 Tax=Kingdonia uniflora TaxID=39325 RepID=A0A7J7LYW4_9MAGN|nr:hypothetical protein GIB67_006727 [Kingdonia uniflora]
MRRKMKERFIPMNHGEIAFDKLQSLKMGLSSLDDYTNQFHLLEARAWLHKTKQQRVSRCKNGLTKKLEEATALQPVFCLVEIVQLAKQANELHAQYRPPVLAPTTIASATSTITAPHTFVLDNCYGCEKPGYQKRDCLTFVKKVGLVVDGMRESVIATIQRILQDEDEEETEMYTTFVHNWIRMTSVCPFAKTARPDDGYPRKSVENNNCQQPEDEAKVKEENNDSSSMPPKCPFGYDSHTFKLGPLSCVICKALLFESSKCIPCSHKFCRACISRFKDCPLCGADIEKIEPDKDLQDVVDRFIEGHARIKRSQVDTNTKGDDDECKTVIYGDVSLERGSFLVQQAMRELFSYRLSCYKCCIVRCFWSFGVVLLSRMFYSDAPSSLNDTSCTLGGFEEGEGISVAMRKVCVCEAFRAQNIMSAKSRLSLCTVDIRVQLERLGNTSELCSQLGAVLGMLGDCCRATGDASSAVTYFEESVEFLSKLPEDDLEVTHTLSVSLNKIGDLKYYDGDLLAARSYYARSLDVRRNAINGRSNAPSQVGNALLTILIKYSRKTNADQNWY